MPVFVCLGIYKCNYYNTGYCFWLWAVWFLIRTVQPVVICMGSLIESGNTDYVRSVFRGKTVKKVLYRLKSRKLSIESIKIRWNKYWIIFVETVLGVVRLFLHLFEHIFHHG